MTRTIFRVTLCAALGWPEASAAATHFHSRPALSSSVPAAFPAARPPRFLEYLPLGGSGETYEIARGPGRPYWFSYEDSPNNAAGTLANDGTVKLYETLTFPTALVAGPDGNEWGTVNSISLRAIVRIAPHGKMTYFSVPGVEYPASLSGICTGPDGNLWFGIYGLSAIGRITLHGKIDLHPLPTPGSPVGIVAGADGALWVTVAPLFGSRPRIDRVTTNGNATEFAIPTNDPNAAPGAIAAGPAGNLWFLESETAGSAVQDHVGVITPNGTIQAFATPTGNAGVTRIALGADGNLWFTETLAGALGKVDPNTGHISEYALPAPPGSLRASPFGIVAAQGRQRRVMVSDNNNAVGVVAI